MWMCPVCMCVFNFQSRFFFVCWCFGFVQYRSWLIEFCGGIRARFLAFVDAIALLALAKENAHAHMCTIHAFRIPFSKFFYSGFRTEGICRSYFVASSKQFLYLFSGGFIFAVCCSSFSFSFVFFRFFFSLILFLLETRTSSFFAFYFWCGVYVCFVFISFLFLFHGN